MTARQMFYILGSAILLSLLVWQIEAEAAPPYPPEIQKRIDGAKRADCEARITRKVGIIAYMRSDEKWLVRIYTKDDEALEIWFNESASRFSLVFGITDKIYFYENEQWLDQDTLPEEEAKRLDLRLKFTGEEKQILIPCLLAAKEKMSRKQ